MTTEHSTLTGSSLHEPKGVASASANKVYVSNGSGSGSWSTVPLAALASNAQLFSNLLFVREQQSTNVSGTSYSNTSTPQKVTLNTTVVNNISGASLTSSVLSLPAGSYLAIGFMYGASNGGNNRLRLRNTSDSTTLAVGGNVNGASSNASGTPKLFNLFGYFTLSGTKNVELQVLTQGFAQNATNNSSDVEVYNDLLIWKIA